MLVTLVSARTVPVVSITALDILVSVPMATRARTVKKTSLTAKILHALQVPHALTWLVVFTANVHSISPVMTAARVSAFDPMCQGILLNAFFSISAIQVDYDLYFSDATRSTAAQVVPFYTNNANSLTIGMWVQFAQKDDSGIFYTLYSVQSAHVPSKRRLMLQAHSSGVQVSLFEDLQDAFLSFREYATINDGQWHHIAIVWDGKSGQLMLITEGLIASKAEYGGGRQLPE